MKKHLSKKTLWQSLLSIIALGIIFILAVGSLYGIFLGVNADQTKRDVGGGMVEVEIEYTQWLGGTETYSGREDEYGRRKGSGPENGIMRRELRVRKK